MVEKGKKYIDITLPQKAIDYYNKKFDDKLFYLTSPEPNNTTKEKSSIDHMYSQTIDYGDIHDLNLNETDAFGNKLSQYFTTKDNKLIGLKNAQYLETASYIKDLTKKKELRPVVSEQFIHEVAFNWFKEKYDGTISTDSKFCGYLIEKIKEEIKEYVIRCPIEFMSIEQPFNVGSVYFDFFTEEHIKDIENNSLKAKKNKTEKEAIKTYLENIRKNYQGKVYSLIKVNAEKNRAIEIAKNETKKAIMVLRFFSPSAVLPKIHQYFGRMGQVHIPSSHIFIYTGVIPIIHTGIDSNHNQLNHHIGQKELDMYDKTGIKILSDLIKKEELNNFEESILTSLSYFTKGISLADYGDKLIYLFTSIEMLLLKNDNEPIQDNLTRRLSFLTDDPSTRKQTIETFKNVYKQRGKYLHHGYKKISSTELEMVQQKIWTAIRKLLLLSDKFETKKELIDDLEKRILSG